MKKSFMRAGSAVILAGALNLAVSTSAVQAGEDTTFDHSVGLSYVSGFSEIIDFYDEAFNLDSSGGIPVGLFYNFTTNFASGLRIDAGLGPLAMIFGDLEYYDVPLRVQVGYTFIPKSSFRPYVKAGVSYHFSDGDYVKDEAGLGLLGTVGVEFGRRGTISGFVEVSHDTAEATFDSNMQGPVNYARRLPYRSEDIKINGTVVSIGVTF